MSPRKAPAVCCSTVGWLAFQPNRPRVSFPLRTSQTMLGLPDIPLPSASSGSANASMAVSGIASSSPMPTIAGATLGDSMASGCSGPWARPPIS